MQETSDGPFNNIKPINPLRPQGRELFPRQFSICLTAQQCLLKPIGKTIRYFFLEESIILLRISSKPPQRLFVYLISLRFCFIGLRSENLFFPWILRSDRIRSLWNVFIGVWDQRRFLQCTLRFYPLFYGSFLVAFIFPFSLIIASNCSKALHRGRSPIPNLPRQIPCLSQREKLQRGSLTYLGMGSLE